MSLSDGAVMAMHLAMERVRMPPSPITTSAWDPRARVTPSSTVLLVALGTTSSNTMCWHALLVQDILDLVDHLALVEDGLGDQEGPLAVLGDQLPDPVDGVQPEDDPRRDVEKDVRHGSLPPPRAAAHGCRAPEKKAENPEGYLRL